MAMKERDAVSMSGWLALLFGIGSLIGAVVPLTMIKTHQHQIPMLVMAAIGLFILGILLLAGCMVIGPNDARVLTFFGRYTGTEKKAGLRWVNPFTNKRAVSLRARNFETAKIKVNDVDGNPIEIGAVIVWRVVDTAQATFDVEDFAKYVLIQAEAAVRNLAMHHPYDTHEDGVLSLRGSSEQIAELLKKEVDDRIRAAGCDVVDARIAHLAYAPEIAQAMLQRQQAGAIIAARQRIVEGAVSMVEMALDQLSTRGIVELDTERKAAMVSNLLVVLCGERSTQPIVNAGTLY
ncbi:MAG: SPFH domain-containing protein [Kofleriaceae bacterium]|nr:SPFH domain-containing protein [Kofleriaceae bacterium]